MQYLVICSSMNVLMFLSHPRLLLLSSPSSALGLEEPVNASATLAPKPEKNP